MFTPTEKRRSTMLGTQSRQKPSASAIAIMRARDSHRLPDCVFHPTLKDESKESSSPGVSAPAIVTPRKRFAPDRRLTERPFHHFILKKTVIYVGDGEVPNTVCVAGSQMGEVLSIAVHCHNKNRVYFFTADPHIHLECKFDQKMDDVLAITSINPFHKDHTPQKLNDRFFLTLSTVGNLAVFQGVARKEDINMLMIPPPLPNHEFTTIKPPKLLGVQETIWHRGLMDVVGKSVSIRLKNDLIGRFSIDLYPSCEVAGDCFAVIRDNNKKCYKMLFKMWIRKHFSKPTRTDDDWSGFCNALHAVLKIHFIVPEFAEDGSSLDHEVMKRKLTESFGSYRGDALIILHCLHDLYENYKLDVKKWKSLQKLGHLLCSLSVNMGAVRYLDHYCRDFTPDVLSSCFGVSMNYLQDRVYQNNTTKMRKEKPFDTQATLKTLLKGEDPFKYKRRLAIHKYATRFEVLKEIYSFIASVGNKLREKLHTKGLKAAFDLFLKCGKELVGFLLSLEWNKSTVLTLPFGFAIPILELIHPLKDYPPEEWTKEAYVLIGREDMVSTLEFQPKAKEPEQEIDGAVFQQTTAEDIVFGSRTPQRLVAPLRLLSTPSRRSQSALNTQQTNDGLDDVFRALGTQQFSRDSRLQQVRQSLNTTVPQDIGVRIGVEPESDIADKIQSNLQPIVLRTLATPVGRGAFTLATVSSSADEIDVGPPICLTGTVKGQRHPAKLKVLNSDAEDAKKITTWPVFHHAVSTALKIKSGVPFLQHFSDTVDGSCNTSCTGAGYFFASGLQGRILKQSLPEVSSRLGGQHVITQIATLLGYGISSRGTGDEEASRCMFLHLPYYHPGSFPEADWCGSLVQTAALMSIGLVYQQTKDNNMSKRMLDEIGRRPGNQLPESAAPAEGVTSNREGYALAAGFAFGLINLGAGNELKGSFYDKMISLLRRYMLGGIDPHVEADREANLNLPPMEGLLGPGGLPWNSALQDAETVSDIFPLNQDVNQEPASGGIDNEHINPGGISHVILEAEHLDTDITSPAATFALALFFLKTNNEEHARFFKIPETEFELDLVRYDFILYRVLAKALVMWDGILPTEEWIQSMLPELMTKHSVEDYFAEEAPEQLHSIGQAHIHGIAGACLAIGLRFASTKNEAGRLLLHKYLQKFLDLKSKAMDGFAQPRDSYGKIDKQMLESLISVLAISLGILLAGSGHLDTYKTLEKFRDRLEKIPSLTQVSSDIGYGDHMAISMAIGFLFLGGGQQGFKTDDASIAALLISILPRFPQLTTDNRCHLQAFRHFYVLAAENRTLSAIDVNSRSKVYVKIKATTRVPKRRPVSPTALLSEEEPVDRMMVDEDYVYLDDELGTPCLLPERYLVESLSVIGPRYYNCTISRKALNHLYETLTLYVKKRDSVLPYEEDEGGLEILKTSDAQQHQPNSTERYSELVEFCGTHQVNEAFAGFARTFCSDLLLRDTQIREFGLFCRSVLSECLIQEKPEMLTVYLQIRNFFEKLRKRPETDQQTTIESILWIKNFRFICSFYDTNSALLFHTADALELPCTSDVNLDDENEAKTLNPLIQKNFLTSINYSVHCLWKALNFCTDDLHSIGQSRIVRYFQSKGSWPRESIKMEQLFACFLADLEVKCFLDVEESELARYCSELILRHI